MLYNIHLQHFSEGGEAGAEASTNAAANFDVDAELRKRFPEAMSGFAAPQEAKAEDKQTDRDAGKEAKTEAKRDAGADKEDNGQPVDRNKAFEELIKGDYKDAFNARVQGIINERFKNRNAELTEANKKIEAYKDAVAAYAMKLGVDPDDVEALSAAVMEDKNNFRAMAVDKGITIEEAMQQFRDERAQTKANAAAAQQQQEAQLAEQRQEELKRSKAVYDAWRADEAEIQKMDPAFNLAKEIRENEDFRGMIQAGVSAMHAYKATHYDQQMASVAGVVERQTAINTAKQIAAGRNRPAEGGLGTTPANSSKTSYMDLSDSEFMKIFKSMGF